MEVKIEGANPSARQIDLVPTEKFYQPEAQPEPPKQEQSKKHRRGKRGKGAKPAAQEAKAAGAKPTRKVVASEPQSPTPRARARSRRVVGPPDEQRGFSKPVKVKAQKIYFGSWGEGPSTLLQSKKSSSRGKRRRR
jgi:ribonuclease R